MSRIFKLLMAAALLTTAACSSSTTAATETTAAGPTVPVSTTVSPPATTAVPETTGTTRDDSTTSTTAQVVYPPTSTTTTIPPSAGIGLQIVDAGAYEDAIPVYLHERVGDRSVQGVRAENVFIGVALWVDPGGAIRTPLAGALTTYELAVTEETEAFSTTPREALLKTGIYSPDGHPLILRVGGTPDLEFPTGLGVVDERVEAGDVIARAGGSTLSLAWGGETERNIVIWAEWGIHPAGEVVAEWFPQFQSGVAATGHLGPRPYKAGGDETISVVNVANPQWGLLPTVLFLHDAGDGPDAPASVLREVDGAVGFSASWQAIDPGAPSTFEAGLQDVACLLRYLRSEAHRYGADPDRVTLAGHGSGGLMAVAAALSPEEVAAMPTGACAYWDEPALITGVVAIGGSFERPADLDALDPAHAAVFDPPAADQSRWFGFVLSDGDTEADPYAITAVADGLAASGYETEVKRAEGDHDQLLNAKHPLQGIPAVRAINKAAKSE